MAAAERFFAQAIKKRGIPQKLTLDGYAASHVAVSELQEEGLLPAKLLVRTNRYLNNLIEQDHRGVKQRIAATGRESQMMDLSPSIHRPPDSPSCTELPIIPAQPEESS